MTRRQPQPDEAPAAPWQHQSSTSRRQKGGCCPSHRGAPRPGTQSRAQSAAGTSLPPSGPGLFPPRVWACALPCCHSRPYSAFRAPPLMQPSGRRELRVLRPGQAAPSWGGPEISERALSALSGRCGGRDGGRGVKGSARAAVRALGATRLRLTIQNVLRRRRLPPTAHCQPGTLAGRGRRLHGRAESDPPRP